MPFNQEAVAVHWYRDLPYQLVPSVTQPGWILVVLSSVGGGWEHVSAHARRSNDPSFDAVLNASSIRTPTWAEMCQLKATFWSPDQVVMQLHPSASNYVNHHPHVLHLWRPTEASIPLPPIEFV